MFLCVFENHNILNKNPFLHFTRFQSTQTWKLYVSLSLFLSPCIFTHTHTHTHTLSLSLSPLFSFFVHFLNSESLFKCAICHWNKVAIWSKLSFITTIIFLCLSFVLELFFYFNSIVQFIWYIISSIGLGFLNLKLLPFQEIITGKDREPSMYE